MILYLILPQHKEGSKECYIIQGKINDPCAWHSVSHTKSNHCSSQAWKKQCFQLCSGPQKGRAGNKERRMRGKSGVQQARKISFCGDFNLSFQRIGWCWLRTSLPVFTKFWNASPILFCITASNVSCFVPSPSINVLGIWTLIYSCAFSLLDTGMNTLGDNKCK